jgi:formylglycine-generating enzyme required for sulfatase activity
MLLQRAGTGTIPPPEFVPPTWSALSRQWSCAPRPTSPTVTLGPADVTLGHHDFEADDGKPEMAGNLSSFEYGWDNESPKRTVKVDQFKVEWRPITNGEFFEFWQTKQEEVLFPKSWSKEGGEVQVCFDRSLEKRRLMDTRFARYTAQFQWMLQRNGRS